MGVLFFSTVQSFRLDYGLLLELHALTLAARSYMLLMYVSTYTHGGGIAYNHKIAYLPFHERAIAPVHRLGTVAVIKL